MVREVVHGIAAAVLTVADQATADGTVRMAGITTVTAEITVATGDRARMAAGTVIGVTGAARDSTAADRTDAAFLPAVEGPTTVARRIASWAHPS